MKKYGLIGESLGHSFSPDYFQRKFEKEDIENTRYDAYELKRIDDVRDLLASPDIAGLNVTIPYKKAVIPFLDGLSEVARAVGAVNTIVKRGNQNIGCNTDVHGFRTSLKPVLRGHHDRALVLGSGGASAAVRYTLKQLGIQTITITRNPKKADQASYEDLNSAAMEHFPLIVNTTPVGQWPSIENCPAIPYESIGPGNLLVDLVYNPEETLFMKRGREKGAWVKNGYDMLVNQAERSWAIWNGITDQDCEPW